MDYKSKVLKAALNVDCNDNMVLLEVKALRCKDSKYCSTDIYEILLNNSIRIMATKLHSFMALRNKNFINLSTEQIIVGDKIWIDATMFLADGSMYIRKRK